MSHWSAVAGMVCPSGQLLQAWCVPLVSCCRHGVSLWSAVVGMLCPAGQLLQAWCVPLVSCCRHVVSLWSAVVEDLATRLLFPSALLLHTSLFMLPW